MGVKQTVVGLTFMIACSACGSDPDAVPQIEPGAVNGVAARRSVDRLALVTAAMREMKAEVAATEVEQMMVEMNGIVSPVLPTAMHGDLGERTPMRSDGGADCTVERCTFDAYGYGVPYTSSRLSGTISHSGDTLAFNLTLDEAQHISSTQWSCDGTLTVTESAISGTVQLTANGGYRSPSDKTASWSWDTTADYEAIDLDDQGCPTGGTAHATTHYRYTTTDKDDHNSQVDIEATADIGPGCAPR